MRRKGEREIFGLGSSVQSLFSARILLITNGSTFAGLWRKQAVINKATADRLLISKE
jgi:hypothetical protein